MFFQNKKTGESKLPEALYSALTAYINRHYEAVVLREMERKRKIEKSLLLEDTGRLPRPYASATVLKSLSLEDVLSEVDAGFSETLLDMIDATGKKDSEIYKRAGLTKQHFSKIRNNPDYKPTKPTAIALALALELDLEKTRDLIGRAGFTLSNSSKFDLIVRFFIEQGKYDLTEINIALYEFDQPLLGS